MNDLHGKSVVLGLTGGIACFKAAELCRSLVKAGAKVQVVMTEAAAQFITAGHHASALGAACLHLPMGCPRG
jgi:phosphopantothenoylcysteine synthetase/decarboxylase